MAPQARFEDGKDIHRLNSLPDEIICHIISFLPLQEMIRTSILSRRWRYLFAQTSSLTIDDNEESPSDLVNFRLLLFNLVNRVLFSRSRDTIDKFCLKFRLYADIYHQIDGWLYYALRHGVQELELKLRKTYGLELPGLPSAGCLFSCKTLVRLELKLGRNFILEVPATVRLPKLKVLHLEKIEFSDGESVQRLFSQCCMLEELIVKNCVWEDANKFTVSNPTLKRLTLGKLRSISHQELEINAPSLVYFEHFDFVAKSYSLLNLKSLVEALIDVEPRVLRFLYPTPSTDLLRGIKAGLLRGISNIKSLHLGCNFSNAYGSRRIPKLDFIGFPFPNLTFLKIDTSFSCDWESLLGSSPCLETLVIELVCMESNYISVASKPAVTTCQEFPWSDGTLFLPGRVPSCLLSHLKTIKFLSFRGENDELRLVEYFLMNAQILQNLTVRISEEKRVLQSEITTALETLPRLSKICHLMIV